MTILINRMPAAIKKGTSFEFVSENFLFTGADGYTLSITLQLKGCPQNIAIFGYLNRKDCDFEDTLLDCEIHDRNIHKYGVVNIVELNETEVKVQFLEGRSKVNFKNSLEDVYINEIDLGSAWHVRESGEKPTDFLDTYDEQKEGTWNGWIVMPWVNNTSGNLQNGIEQNGQAQWDWKTPGTQVADNSTLVVMPFLLEVLGKIFDELDYDYDLTAIENSQYKDLILCNALPVAWDVEDYKYALPHWTVKELLEELELFLNGHFTIDDSLSIINFAFNKDYIGDESEVEIENVVEEFTTEIDDSEDSEAKYIEDVNVAYADCDHQLWKYYSCQWAIGTMKIQTWETYSAMYNALDDYFRVTSLSNQVFKKIHYCEEIDTYFVLIVYKQGGEEEGGVWHYYCYCRLMPINVFGSDAPENATVKQTRIVPACIDYLDETDKAIFLECGTYGDETEEDDEWQSKAVNTLIAGEKEKKSEYLDKIYVAFWDGYYDYYPHPGVDISDFENSYPITHSYSMRIQGSLIPTEREKMHSIDSTRKYTFKFLADAIPDVTSVFIINGKKYLAEKITATFSAELGMSQLLKMEAYRIDS